MKPYYQDEWVTIYHGDCREILPSIPDKSIDLVLTDPPYAEDAIELYEVAARESKRLLKDGRFFYAYCGAMFLPELLVRIGKYLDWFWLHNLRHNGGYPTIWKTHMQQNSKPILAYTNGKPNLINLAWSFTDFTKDKPDKHFHKGWGQGIIVPQEIISMRTQEGDIIIDPYVGGGCVPMAAKKLNRK